MAQGEWIYFVDDDDCINQTGFLAATQLASKESVDFVYGSYCKEVVKPDYREMFNPVRCQQPDRANLLIGNTCPIGTYLIRRKKIKHAFNEALRTHEDWLFLLDNLSELQLAEVEGCMVVIRERDGQDLTHRNKAHDQIAVAMDYFRIYSLHPAPDMRDVRLRVLSCYPKFDMTAMI